MSTQPPTLTTTSQADDTGIDISPISPADRRNSLEKHLQTRPEEQDLKNRHILLDTNAAPSLQAKALELERQRATDNLKKGLGKRPERGELVDREFSWFFRHSVASSFVNPKSWRLRRHSFGVWDFRPSHGKSCLGFHCIGLFLRELFSFVAVRQMAMPTLSLVHAVVFFFRTTGHVNIRKTSRQQAYLQAFTLMCQAISLT
jgi:hypothetical protein